VALGVIGHVDKQAAHRRRQLFLADFPGLRKPVWIDRLDPCRASRERRVQFGENLASIRARIQFGFQRGDLLSGQLAAFGIESKRSMLLAICRR